ncbi:hypothetical protein DVH24_008115 [Malus domestica]|uniref:Uncharacterized protein n=1 Tax=Malus domestica TaxID=3750 RepID=A0A498JKR8_MALDO|nr:hypothetical protein DVH24_008115 [Malus domestica]
MRGCWWHNTCLIILSPSASFTVLANSCCWDRTKPRATLPVKADNKEKVVVLKTPVAVKIPKLYGQIYKTIVLSVKS